MVVSCSSAPGPTKVTSSVLCLCFVIFMNLCLCFVVYKNVVTCTMLYMEF
jgi:hypothetical protein